METDSDFISLVKNGLKQSQTTYVLSLFEQPEHQQAIQNGSWDLIPIICKHLTEIVKTNNKDLYCCSDKLINIVAVTANPEECVLQLIEELEEARDDTEFVTLLKPLQTVLSRVQAKHEHSFAWSLGAIKNYVEKLEIPESLNLEGDEKILTDADPTVDRITRLYLDLLPFCDVFMEESFKTTTQCKTFRNFLIHLLGKPLAYLNMEKEGKTESRARRIAGNLCQKIMKVLIDPICIAEYECDEQDILKSAPLACAVLFYLIYGEHFVTEKIPKVYDPIYVFQRYLHLVSALNEDHQFIINKSLKLADAFVKSVKGLNLTYQLLDSDAHRNFFKVISNTITYNPSENYRRLGLRILQDYVDSFEIRGRYLLIYNMINTVNRPSLVGYMVTYYKEILNNALTKDSKCISPYFSGEKLFNLLKSFCYLHKGEESDLVELADQIIASLNLLRYLAIRDKTNLTKIWDYFDTLERVFFTPLKKGLLLSRAHYELKINDLQEEMKTTRGANSHSSASITVGGQLLPDMPHEEKMNVLTSAVTAFDVMESLLARVVELVESRK